VGTKTGKKKAKESKKGYDSSRYPAFAVTVDVVILTVAEGRLQVLLVRRGVAPFEGLWAIPGGFKRPDETLLQAAERELATETGLEDVAALLQLGSYGDPGRDPRMNVVTVAHLAVVPAVGRPTAGSDAAAASLVPVAEALDGTVELAFDHRRILADAVERVRADLDLSGLATAFLDATFTLAELRAVYEAVWGVRLDAANFRRKVVGEAGWVVPTSRRARPGANGGKPAELFRAGRNWKLGSPVRRGRPGARQAANR
jgi:8-oxo-dGTP diphosphatase